MVSFASRHMPIIPCPCLRRPPDLTNIRLHLDMLRRLSGPKPSLCDALISRLEGALGSVQTPDATLMQQQHDHNSQMSPHDNPAGLDYSWQIFNQVSLQHFEHLSLP